MAFTTKIKLRAPEDCEATITITANIKELVVLREQLRKSPDWGNYPIQTFMRQMTAGIDWAEKQFLSHPEGGEDEK